jgi:peptide/nickel transport system substrate-binding protein
VKPTLAFGISFAPSDIDPSEGTGQYKIVTGLAYEALIHMEPNGTFSPGLATGWRISKGNTRFVFTLRHDARFSDGTPVTARAVAAWLNYVQHAPANATGLGEFGKSPSFTAAGKWTVRISLKSPEPSIPWILSDDDATWGLVAGPKCFSHAKLTKATCGAGPYMLVPGQTVASDHYTFVPNPYYYDPSKQYWRKVSVKVVTTPSSMLQALQSGQLDVAEGDSTTMAAARAAGFKVTVAPDETLDFFLNVSGSLEKALADIRVRQALNYALNRPVLAKTIVGFGTDEVFGLGGFNKKYNDYYHYNPAKAKALLAAAGYANGLTIGPVDVDAWNGQLGTPIAEAVASQLAAVGVTLKLQPENTVASWGNLYATSPMFEVGPTFVPESPAYIQILTQTAAPFDVHDPILTSLGAAAKKAADPTKYYQRLTARAVTQAYFLPIVAAASSTGIWYSTKKVKGVQPGADRGNGPVATEWSPGK